MASWEPIPVLRGQRPDLAEAVTMAWRRNGGAKSARGASSVAVVNVSRKLAAAAGWGAEVRQVVVEVDRAAWRLRLRPAGPEEPHARSLQHRNGTRSANVPLAWVESGPRPAAPVRHQVDGRAIIIELPSWASGTRTTRPTEQGRAPIAGGGAPAEAADAAAPSSGDGAPRPRRVEGPHPRAGTAPAEDDARARADALVRELWPRTEVSVPEIARRLGEVLGRPVSLSYPYTVARRVGLPTVRSFMPAAPAAAPPPDPPAPPPEPAAAPAPEPARADQALAARHAQARELLRRGLNPDDVAATTRLPPREVLRLRAELREAARTTTAPPPPEAAAR